MPGSITKRISRRGGCTGLNSPAVWARRAGHVVVGIPLVLVAPKPVRRESKIARAVESRAPAALTPADAAVTVRFIRMRSVRGGAGAERRGGSL